MISDAALLITISFLALAILCSVYRLIIGPSSPDRVVALDLLATFGIGIVAVQAIVYDEPVFLDVAVIIALVAFLGTVAFAYYLEKRVDK